LEENDTQMFQAPLATAAGGGEGGKDGGLEREVVGEIGKLVGSRRERGEEGRR